MAQNLAQIGPKPTPPVQIWQPPRLVVTAPGEAPIRLEAVRVRGELNGRQALTEIELTFYNPNGRVLEGELQFPLLAGQNIAGFAMDVNGVLREAVPVDKARGQQVFEEVIRTRIDPGLLEVTHGNNFKLRVYPIPAQGRKHVVLRITETLNETAGAGGEKSRIAYRLPAAFGETVDEFRLDVSIRGAGKPQFLRNPLGEMDFRSDDGGAHWQAHTVQRGYTGSGVIELSAAVANTPLVFTQRFEGKTYFLADVPVENVEIARKAPRAIPNLVGLVWDASGSGAARDHGREFALLDAYFHKMRSGEVRLSFIRNDAEPVKAFRIVDGDWRELKKALMETAYDGATNLGAFKPEAPVAEYQLFSDGLSNFGEQPFATTKVPLFAISAAVKSDPVFLAFVAHRSGGQFIDLVKETPAEASQKLLNAVTRVELLDAEGVSQVMLQSPFPQGGRIQLAGVLNEVSGTVPIRVLQSGAAAQRINVAIRSGGANSSLPAAAWARMRVNELDGEHHLNRAEIRRLGQRFKLVTRETSLIVLDRVEDYARFEILPPPELRADYERALANLARSRAGERQSHLEQIVRRFADKVTWWNTDFPKSDPPVALKQKDDRVERIVVTGSNLSLQESARNDAVVPPPEVRMNAPQAAGRVAEQAATTARTTAAAPPVFAAPKAADRSRLVAADAVVSTPAAAPVTQPAAPAKPASEPTGNSAVIQLQKWQPGSAYISRMREAAAADLYRIYLDEKPGYANSVAFYLDVADLFIDRRQDALAIRILSNLAEMDLENRHILRVLGYRLLQARAPKLAIPVLKRVLELSPEEPQSYRDLGLAYAANNQPQAAIDSLNEVVIRPWHNRFPDIELIALAELNAIVATNSATLDTSRIDPRLLKNLPLDVRAVLAWDADNTDIDLWVTDPNGEKAFYGHQLTRQGGRMSQDFTGGYGPEEFSLKTAKPGKYRIEAQYFGDRRQNIAGPTTLWVRLTTHFGSAAQQDQTVTLRLKDRSETVLVGEFEIK